MQSIKVNLRVGDRLVAIEAVQEGEIVCVVRHDAKDPDDAEKLQAAVAGLRGNVRRVEIDSPRVSRVHCVLWIEGGKLHMRDVDSTHGTRVNVARATLATPDHEVEIWLYTSSHVELSPPDGLDLSVERTEAAFAEKLVQGVNAWARRVGAQFMVSVEPRRREDNLANDPARIAIGSSHAVLIERSLHTAQVTFEVARTIVVRHVAEQNAQFMKRSHAVLRGAESDAMVTASPSMRAICWRLADYAANGLSVVLLGETGTGKRLLAHRYHAAFGGKGFEMFDCTQYEQPTRLRVELFGAEPAAVEGLHQVYVGAVERAKGGTLFIDEIGDLRLEHQAQLLTFLDEGTFRRVMGTREHQSDARVICGTRQDLRAAVREGRFREDLWYRLAGVVIMVPPLRERPDDILALLGRHTVTVGEEERTVAAALTDEARSFLLGYPWPGNARELVNFCRRLRHDLGGRDAIDRALVENALTEGSVSERPVPSGRPAPSARAQPWRPPAGLKTGRFDGVEAPSWDGVIDAALRDYARARGVTVDGHPSNFATPVQPFRGGLVAHGARSRGRGSGGMTSSRWVNRSP